MYVVLQGMPCCDYVVICTCKIRCGVQYVRNNSAELLGGERGAMVEIAFPLCVTYVYEFCFFSISPFIHISSLYNT